MIYGYARVSTKGQAKNGNSLQDQTEALLAAGCETIYADSFTGTTMDRPKFAELLGMLKAGDTLVVTKLDRFARTASEGAAMIRELVERGIEVNVLNMGKANNTPMGKLMVTVMFAFAEFERDMIVERTTAGKAIKRANDPGWHEGRKSKQPAEFEVVLRKQKAGELTVTECCAQLGVSRSWWYAKTRETA